MFPDVTRTPVDADALSRYTSERQFTALAHDLLREAASYVCLASCIMGEQPTWNRNQAIIGGNAVRIFKLLASLLDQVVQDRRETVDILSRLVFETAVNVRYLAQEWTEALANDYVRHSLRHERKLSDTIDRNIKARKGEVLPIEDRMRESLERTARGAGVRLKDVDLSDKAPWGKQHLAQKAKTVGWEDAYDAVFGGMSHNVHGSWQDLYTHHLEMDDQGRFTPDLGWSRPRPQPLLALATIAIQVAADVSTKLGGAEAFDSLSQKLNDLDDRIRTVDKAHENYLQQRKWPAT